MVSWQGWRLAFSVREQPCLRGVEASFGAEIAPGAHPVVLFSHGIGGTDRAQAWLASELASRGAIVVMVNHPNSTWGDFDMVEGVRHWTRVADLSIALDNLAEDPAFAGHIDPSRIMAAGFSYGGWTALSLGGITGNLNGIVEACTTYGETTEACGTLLSEEVSMQTQDPDAWNASYADPRVTHVTAIDPGFVWGLDTRNTSSLLSGAVLIGLGDGTTRMFATNFEESGLADLLPDARIVQLEPAFHFTAMPLCTPKGRQILEAEDDDPVCTDPSGTDRAVVHSAIIDAISEALAI
ncbi:hypothetical protein ETW23_23140 (plasmid) [Leisingera sp. NJS201]|nr:hypothetical protein ETW23_23140 [Leisingera sp. NJS201]